MELVRTQVFLPKKFEYNEFTLRNVPERVEIEKIKSRQSGHKTLCLDAKF